MAYTKVEIDIDGIINMSDHAFCVDVGKGRWNGIWIPRSLVEDIRGMDEEEEAEWITTTKTVTIPEWFAIQKGLI